MAGLLLVVVAGLAVRTYFRYQKADTMEVAVREYISVGFRAPDAHSARAVEGIQMVDERQRGRPSGEP